MDSTSLAVKKKGKEALSKGRSVFNRLIKKVEKLRKDIDPLHKQLDTALARHTLKVVPAEAETTKLHVELIDLLYPYYTNTKALSAKERRILGSLIGGRLYHVIGFDYEALDRHKEMFKALNGEDFDAVVKQDMESTRDDINRMFAEHGFEFDLGDVDLTDEEAMARALHALQEKVMAEQERQQQPPKRKKTTRRLEMEARAEEMEKARNRSLATIYKQLARSLHPDLEQDGTLKAEKEELMKQLTAAYEAQDLHTLLKLEAQWLSRNSDNIQALTEEKLDIYNAVLKEQVAELETEYHRAFGHPRYEPLVQYGMYFAKGLAWEIDRRAKHLRTRNLSLEESIANLKGKNPLWEVKACIEIALLR
ncbi:MAG: hypothetical protein KF797_07965 [Flavobacteriales bacterium]|nr:hypothetical protein [Flavobacteriales bacterium]